MYIHSAKTAIVNVTKSGISSDFFTFIDFYISPMAYNTKLLARLGKFKNIYNKIIKIFCLELTSSINVCPIIKYNRICGILKDDFKNKFEKIYSEIGELHETLFFFYKKINLLKFF